MRDRLPMMHMHQTIKVDSFTRLKHVCSGTVSPAALPRLTGYLASEDGEVSYAFTGNTRTDASGSQKNSIKCIIYGWFFLTDPNSLEPVRHDLQIESTLVVVKEESMLPPLDLETDDEDYIVCAGEMDLLERMEEEILLDLPATAIQSGPSAAARKVAVKGNKASSAVPAVTKKNSPFAKLAELKKK